MGKRSKDKGLPAEKTEKTEKKPTEDIDKLKAELQNYVAWKVQNDHTIADLRSKLGAANTAVERLEKENKQLRKERDNYQAWYVRFKDEGKNVPTLEEVKAPKDKGFPPMPSPRGENYKKRFGKPKGKGNE